MKKMQAWFFFIVKLKQNIFGDLRFCERIGNNHFLPTTSDIWNKIEKFG